MLLLHKCCTNSHYLHGKDTTYFGGGGIHIMLQLFENKLIIRFCDFSVY